jgi:hypothetical protein
MVHAIPPVHPKDTVRLGCAVRRSCCRSIDSSVLSTRGWSAAPHSDVSVRMLTGPQATPILQLHELVDFHLHQASHVLHPSMVTRVRRSPGCIALRQRITTPKSRINRAHSDRVCARKTPHSTRHCRAHVFAASACIYLLLAAANPTHRCMAQGDVVRGYRCPRQHGGGIGGRAWRAATSVPSVAAGTCERQGKVRAGNFWFAIDCPYVTHISSVLLCYTLTQIPLDQIASYPTPKFSHGTHILTQRILSTTMPTCSQVAATRARLPLST